MLSARDLPETLDTSKVHAIKFSLLEGKPENLTGEFFAQIGNNYLAQYSERSWLHDSQAVARRFIDRSKVECTSDEHWLWCLDQLKEEKLGRSIKKDLIKMVMTAFKIDKEDLNEFEFRFYQHYCGFYRSIIGDVEEPPVAPKEAATETLMELKLNEFDSKFDFSSIASQPTQLTTRMQTDIHDYYMKQAAKPAWFSKHQHKDIAERFKSRVNNQLEWSENHWRFQLKEYQPIEKETGIMANLLRESFKLAFQLEDTSAKNCELAINKFYYQLYRNHHFKPQVTSKLPSGRLGL